MRGADLLVHDAVVVRIALFAGGMLALAYVLTLSDNDVTDRGRADVAGQARVVDGDTFWIGDTKIRLFGVNAPEAADPLGPTATRWLRNEIGGRDVACFRKDTDRYGRMVAVCEVDGNDLSSGLTQVGLAKAYRRFSLDYVDEEETARAEGLGIWAQATTVSQPCAIKGNVSDSGKLYHMPGSQVYSAVRINTSRGERWFCSENEALDAGWRPAGG